MTEEKIVIEDWRTCIRQDLSKAVTFLFNAMNPQIIDAIISLLWLVAIACDGREEDLKDFASLLERMGPEVRSVLAHTHPPHKGLQ